MSFTPTDNNCLIIDIFTSKWLEYTPKLQELQARSQAKRSSEVDEYSQLR